MKRIDQKVHEFIDLNIYNIPNKRITKSVTETLDFEIYRSICLNIQNLIPVHRELLYYNRINFEKN